MNHHEQHTHRILSELEKGEQVTQRSLARDLGIALGLTNLLLRRLIRKGWVRAIRLKPNRVLYLLTPTGIAEKAKISRAYLRHSVRFYVEARTRIQSLFEEIHHEIRTARAAPPEIIFWGAGEIAEVGYVCLQNSGLTLIGVVDQQRPGNAFFEHVILAPASLSGYSLDGRPFHWVVVMSLEDPSDVQRQLVAMGIDQHRVFWV